MKKAISLFLCLALLAGTFALGAANIPFAVEAAASGADITNATSPTGPEPPGYANAQDPYKLAGTNNEKQIAALSELMFSVNNTSKIDYRIGDNLKPDKIDGTNDALNFDSGSAYFESTSGGSSSISGVFFTRSAALDADGDGQRESVVYVGWRASDKKVVAWVVNARTKQTSSVLTVGTAAEGIQDLYGGRVAAVYQSLNFFSITSGDFNGNKKETAVAVLPLCKPGDTDYEVPQVIEFTVNASNNTISKGNGTSGYVNQAFFDDDEIGIADSTDYEDLLSTQITSGDFNGDGKDDIAVLSYTNNISTTYDDEDYIDLYVPFLRIGHGSSSGIPALPGASTMVINNEKTSGSDKYWDMPIAGNLIGADIDNDGRDEIVIAGYYGQVTGTTSGKDYYMVDSSRTASNIILVSYDADNSLSMKSWEKKAPNGWTSTTGESVSGVWLAQDYCWQPIGMGAARIDGIGKAEYVFISGSVYQYKNGKLEAVYTPGYFNSMDAANDSNAISVTFISSVDNGVFDGNYSTYEQIAFVVGLKESSQSIYHCIAGVLGKKDVKNGDAVTRDWFCNDVEDSKTYRGKDWLATVNAVDCDNDIVKVKFRSKSYGWSDPDIIGVLQAAPYFGELGDYEGETTISMSTSYESEYAESCSQSLGVGGMFEVDAEVFEMEIKAGYSGSWSQTTFSTQSHSQTFSVTAGPHDTVIVRRTPVFDFSYDIWDAQNKKWSEGGYHINVVKESTYYTFSVDEYNQFATIYNDQMQAVYGNNFKKFKLITEENAPYLIGNEGNPYAYTKGSLGAMTATLGHNGGSQAISYEDSYGSGTSSSEENGFSFEMSACGGSEHVKFGLYINTEFMWGAETTETTVSGTGTEGSVSDIDDSASAEETDSPSDIVHQYGFQWSFGKWDLNLLGNENVPVYGYNVNNITGPAPRVTDLEYEVTNGGTELTFDWSEPPTGEGQEIAGYFLYKSVEGRPFTKVSDDIITDTTYTLTQDDYDRTKNTVFAVTSAFSNTAGNYTYYTEGLFSNQCRFNGDLNGRSAYEIALDEGFEGTVDEWLESLKGATVKKVEKTSTNGLVDTYTITFSDNTTAFFNVTNGASAYEVAKSNGYQGTVEQWLALIGADCAQGHTYTEFTMPASCGRPGCTVKVCSKCGASEFSMTDALEHNYTSTVVPATHTTCGYTRYVCENCGDTYCDNLTAVTEHTYTSKVVAPTCVESGYTEKTCTECGIVIRTDIVEPTGHSYTATVTEPTCSHYGYTTYKCENCDSEYVSDITPTTDHNFSTKVISSTCCTGGYTIRYCADCGFSVIEDETQAKGHTFEVSKVFAPTCSTAGYSIYTCTECGVNYIDDETDPVAHTPGEWVCEDPATGKYTKRCENCYKLLDTKTVSIVSGDGNGQTPLNPNIDENGILNIGYKESERVTLKVDGVNSSTVVYESSDPKVATVDSNGNVTAVGPGDAVITASIPGTAIQTKVPVNVKLTWWQKVHYFLDSSPIFRLFFMLFKINIPTIRF